MKNSTVITNSEFSRKAIFEAFDGSSDSGRGIDEVQILRLPVDVDTCRRVLLSSTKNKREEDDIVIVVPRIDKAKENWKCDQTSNIAKAK